MKKNNNFRMFKIFLPLNRQELNMNDFIKAEQNKIQI